MISPDLIERLRAETNLRDLLPELDESHKCLCPFHEEKKPSLQFFPDTNSWRCFGCGKGGSVFDYLMHRDGLSFLEAVRSAAQMQGIELDKTDDHQLELSHKRSEILGQLVHWGYQQLWEDNGSVRNYLIKERHWPAEICQKMRLGLVRLSKFAEAVKLSQDDLSLAGLVSASNKPLFSDERICFPCEYRGKVQYATFRTLPNGKDPKFIHLAKGTLGVGNTCLFAQDNINGKEVWLCEGAPDVMTALTLGCSAVGTLGKTLPDPKVFRNTQRVVIINDNDALETAIQNGLKILSQQRSGECSILSPPPQHKDLSDWNPTSEVLLNAVRQPVVSAQIQWLKSQRLPARALEEKLKGSIYPLLPLLSKIEQDQYLREIKAEFDIAPALSKQIIKEMADVPEAEHQENSILVDRNNVDYSLALDFFNDPDDGQPTMLYATYRYEMLETQQFRESHIVKYYLLCKAQQIPIFAPLICLNLPPDQKKLFPVRRFINWDIMGDFGLEDFLKSRKESPKLKDIYEDIILLFSRYIWCPDASEYDVIALYCIMTYLHPIFQVMPYLHFFGTAGVGKSASAAIMKMVCFNGMTLASPTEAHALREPARNRATIIFDEGDRYHKAPVGSPAANIVDLLRSANKKGTSGIRYDADVNDEGDREPAVFDPYGPKIFTSRKEMDINLAERCIIIALQPADPEILKSMPNVGSCAYEWQPQAKLLCNKLHFWLFSNFWRIADLWGKSTIQKILPGAISGRANELWSPLLCIAHYIDCETNPATLPLQGSLTKKILQAEKIKSATASDRARAENPDIKFLDGMMNAIENVADTDKEIKSNVIFFRQSAVCEKMTEHIASLSGDSDFKVSQRYFGNMVRKLKLTHEAYRRHDPTNRGKMIAYISLDPAQIKAKHHAILRGMVEQQVEEQSKTLADIVNDEKLPF